jgi:hypothetical protein
MILSTAVRSGLAAARSAARVVTAAGSHAAWWLNYRIGGTSHRAPEDPRRRPPADS